MTTTFNVADAKAHFSDLLRRVEAGEDVVLARGGKPIARVTRLSAERREFGFFPDIWIAADFDDPLPEEELRLWEQ